MANLATKERKLETLLAQPIQYWNNIETKTIKQAIECDSPTLAQLTKVSNVIVVKAVLTKILESLIGFFNVGKSLNDYQLNETLRIILNEYYFLKIEDFKICFDGIKTGKYLPKREGQKRGQLYDRLDGQIIIQAISEYCDEKSEIFQAIQEELKLKEEECGELYHVMIGEKYFALTNENEYFEEERKDAAKLFSYNEAFYFKKFITQEEDYKHKSDKVKIVFYNKPDIGKIQEEIVNNNPKLKYKQAMENYKKRKKEILDSDLSDFDKNNEIRKISNLKPLTKEEFIQSQKKMEDFINNQKQNPNE